MIAKPEVKSIEAVAASTQTDIKTPTPPPQAQPPPKTEIATKTRETQVLMQVLLTMFPSRFVSSLDITSYR